VLLLPSELLGALEARGSGVARDGTSGGWGFRGGEGEDAGGIDSGVGFKPDTDVSSPVAGMSSASPLMLIAARMPSSAFLTACVCMA